jgi:hypothetical protein
MNARAHTWKACWGQPLRSSNLLSSATSDQAIHKPRSCVRPGLARLRSLICSLIHSTHIGIKCPKGAGARFWVLSRWGRPLGVSALSDQLAAGAGTMGERLGSDELEGSAGWTAAGVAGVLTGEQARTIAAAAGGGPAENLLPAAWWRVSLAAGIAAAAARGWRRLAEQEGGTQMRTSTGFLLPARTSCTRSFRYVQLSVPPRQAAV